MSGGTRIEFPADDPARFNQLRDSWRGAAASCTLPKIGHRLASVLPNYVNREYGYAFPTDDDLAETVTTSPRNIGKGMAALDAAELIDRLTTTKRDNKGEAIGKQRRIFLTMPKARTSRDKTGLSRDVTRDGDVTGERNTSSDVNGTEVNGTPEVNGTKRVSERNDGVPNIPDRITPDLKTRSGENPVSSHTHARELSVHLPPDTDPSHSWASDVAFMTKFDEAVLDRVRAEEVAAGSIQELTQFAFDYTTRSSLDFMPVYWADLLACRTNTVAEWFLNRTSRLIHLAEAA